MPICSMPVLLGGSQPGLVILVFQNEVSTISGEEKNGIRSRIYLQVTVYTNNTVNRRVILHMFGIYVWRMP